MKILLPVGRSWDMFEDDLPDFIAFMKRLDPSLQELKEEGPSRYRVPDQFNHILGHAKLPTGWHAKVVCDDCVVAYRMVEVEVPIPPEVADKPEVYGPTELD